MRLFQFLVLGGVCLALLSPTADGAPARFWISQSSTSPVPVAPIINNAAVGMPQTLYIWVQPATSNGSFRTLEGFTLDIATLDSASLQLESTPIIDFVDGTFIAENPTITSTSQQRFQFTADSNRTAAYGGPLLSDLLPESIAGDSPDGIKGLQGISPNTVPAVAGIGHANDPLRFGTGNAAAWRVGQFSFQPLSTGQNDLFLQIGWQGIRHLGDPTNSSCNSTLTCGSGTEVVFGTSNIVYNAHNLDHRQMSRELESFDVRINAVEAPDPVFGDYSGNHQLDSADYTYWRNQFARAGVLSADGNADGIVNAADYVLWRKLMAAPAGAGSGVFGFAVPEPSCISLIGLLLMLLHARNARRMSAWQV